jgi:transposase
MKAYSKDLRLKIANANGLYVDICKAFNVSLSTVSKFKTQLRKEGNVDVKWSKTNKKRLLTIDQELELASHLGGNSNTTLAEIKIWIEHTYAIHMSVSSIHRYVKNMHFSFKKKL